MTTSTGSVTRRGARGGLQDGSSPHTDRIPQLDSLRGIAALGVVIYHYGYGFDARPWSRVLFGFYQSGLLLVDFFFILSGFVLARTYWTEPRSGRFGKNVVERVARLYPLHLFTLLAVVAGQAVLVHVLGAPGFGSYIRDARHFFLNLLLLQAVGLEQGQSFNGPSWSISTEWVVNLLFFALICMRRRPAAAIFLAIVVACCGGPVGAAGWHLAPSLQRTMCGFFICALLQYVLGARIDEARVRPAWHWDASLIALLAGLATMAIHGGSFSAGFLDRIGGKYAIFGIAVVLAPIGLVSSRLLGLGILKFCGEISYSIYLVHFSLELGLAILERALGVRLPVDSGWFLILFLVGTVVVSWATYRWVEVPGKRLVRTWAAAFST